MKLSCRDCGSAFHVPAGTVSDLGQEAYCPFCGAALPLSQPPPDLGSTGQPTTPSVPEGGLLDLSPEALQSLGSMTLGISSPSPTASAAEPVEDALTTEIPDRPRRGEPAPNVTMPLATPVPDPPPGVERGLSKPEGVAIGTDDTVAPATPFPESDPFAPIGTSERLRSYTYDPLDSGEASLDEEWPESTVTGVEIISAEEVSKDAVEPAPAQDDAPKGEPLALEEAEPLEDADPLGADDALEEAEPLPPDESLAAGLPGASDDAPAAAEGFDALDGPHDPSLLELDSSIEADLLTSDEVAVITDVPGAAPAAEEAIDAPDLFVQSARSWEDEDDPAEVVARAGAPAGGTAQGWRLEKDGPTEAPVGRAEVLRRIRAGELAPEDLAAPAPGEDWQPLEEIASFRRYVNLYGRRKTSPPEGQKKGFWRRLTGD